MTKYQIYYIYSSHAKMKFLKAIACLFILFKYYIVWVWNINKSTYVERNEDADILKQVTWQ
jgi:hypothetical protein